MASAVAPQHPRPWRPWLILLLAVHAALLAHSSTQHCATLNEPGYLLAGLSHLSTGRFDLYRVNPPLVRIVAAIPVAVTGFEEDWSEYGDIVGAHPVFDMGVQFIRVNGRRSIDMLTAARWTCIPFCLLGAWICFAWARDLFGASAGYVAATLWCFSPCNPGHSSVIAPNAHATALLMQRLLVSRPATHSGVG